MQHTDGHLPYCKGTCRAEAVACRQLERRMHEMFLHNNSLRVADPADADLFFIPVPLASTL